MTLVPVEALRARGRARARRGRPPRRPARRSRRGRASGPASGRAGPPPWCPPGCRSRARRLRRRPPGTRSRGRSRRGACTPQSRFGRDRVHDGRALDEVGLRGRGQAFGAHGQLHVAPADLEGLGEAQAEPRVLQLVPLVERRVDVRPRTRAASTRPRGRSAPAATRSRRRAGAVLVPGRPVQEGAEVGLDVAPEGEAEAGRGRSRGRRASPSSPGGGSGFFFSCAAGPARRREPTPRERRGTRSHCRPSLPASRRGPRREPRGAPGTQQPLPVVGDPERAVGAEGQAFLLASRQGPSASTPRRRDERSRSALSAITSSRPSGSLQATAVRSS